MTTTAVVALYFILYAIVAFACDRWSPAAALGGLLLILIAAEALAFLRS